MTLSLADVARIADLARLDVTADEAADVHAKLGAIFGLIDQLSAVDTAGVTPLAHPLECFAPLREDAVTEHDERDLYQSAAPAVEHGLYLVPRVVE
jgi:aspartyl-tRNA(Asn)/glutamyl-tRNA(Gln) amidotransferase subunit C